MGLEGSAGRGGTGRRGKRGRRRKVPALSVFIMIRDVTMLWHHVSLGTVTPHLLPPPSIRHRRRRVHPKMRFRTAAEPTSTPKCAAVL